MLEFDSNTPIYIQIIEFLKKQIVSNKLKAGEKLLSVREMANLFNVNPNTIQRVFQELEREGLTYTERGMGTYVTDNLAMIEKLREQYSFEIVDNFLSTMKEMGYSSDEIIDCLKKRLKNWEVNK